MTGRDEDLPASRRELDQRLGDLTRYLERQFNAEERARVLAAEALNLRLERMNEFRDQIEKERGEYVRKDQMDIKFDRLQFDVQQLEKAQGRAAVAQGRLDGRQLGILGLVGAAAGSVIGALVSFLRG